MRPQTPTPATSTPAGVGHKLAEGAVVAACALSLALVGIALFYGWFLR